MEALDIIRQEAYTLTPDAARVAQHYVTTHLKLSDWWRTALAVTLGRVASNAHVPCGHDLDDALGTPDAWTTAMMMDITTFEMRAWLRGAQALADLHDVTPAPRRRGRSA
jgi:hypothetical protein